MRANMIVLGHRGGRGPGWPPENTLDAFSRAFDEGADGVELDVRLCASGEPVVFHDPSLAHMTNGRDRRGIHVVRRSDLPRFDNGAMIPTLAETLDTIRARKEGSIVNVEVKADSSRRVALVRAVARDLVRARSGLEVVVSSFDPAIVLAFMATAAARVERGMLIGPRTPRLATALPLVMRRALRAAHLESTIVTKARVDRLHRGGLRVVSWTVNDNAPAMKEMGVDWLITDQPAQIIASLRHCDVDD